MKGKVGEVPMVREGTIMETNTPHDVTISHTVGCLPSVHEAMNSAEEEVWMGHSTAAGDPSDLGI